MVKQAVPQVVEIVEQISKRIDDSSSKMSSLEANVRTLAVVNTILIKQQINPWGDMNSNTRTREFSDTLTDQVLRYNDYSKYSCMVIGNIVRYLLINIYNYRT